MKAAIYTEYGPPSVLHVKEVSSPLPRPEEILVRVKATSVNYGDIVARNFGNLSFSDFNMPGFLLFPAKLSFGYTKPKKHILGSEFAGIVEETGDRVSGIKPGDKVFGYTGQSMGCNAEFICINHTKTIAHMPQNMDFDEAAVVPYGTLMALNILRGQKITNDQKVLIIGASGSIGSAMVQIAKNHYGAGITGVCGPAGITYVKALGADRVIDYSRENFWQGDDTYDFIFDILGKSEFSVCKKLLNQNGRYVRVSFKTKHILQAISTKIFGRSDGKRVICTLASDSREDLITIKEMIESGKFKAIPDRKFPLEKIAEAHTWYSSGEKQGSVVITY